MCKNINIIYVGRKLTLKLTDVEKPINILQLNDKNIYSISNICAQKVSAYIIASQFRHGGIISWYSRKAEG